MTIRPVVLALLAVAAAATEGRAQCDMPPSAIGAGCATGCTCDACGRCDQACIDSHCGGTSSADRAAAAAAAVRDQIRIEVNAAERAGAAERAQAIRRANEKGLAAFKARDWDLAVEYFAGALQLDPSDTLVAANLRAARVQQAIEQARRADAAEQRRLAHLLASGPAVPSPRISAAVIDARLPDDLPSDAPDVRAYCTNTFEFLKQRTRDAADANAHDALDVLTPEGLFLRVQENVLTLDSKVLEWTTAVANGSMPLEQAALLPQQGATILFNVGEPGQFAADLVEARSAGAVVAKRLSDVIQGGIGSLTAAVGATVLHPRGPANIWRASYRELEQVGELAPVIRDDIQRIVGGWTQRPSAPPPSPQPP